MSAFPVSPSSASAYKLLNGAKGGVPSFFGHWALRSALIAPGLALAGVRGRQIVVGSLTSSAMISAFLLIYTGANQAGELHGMRRYRRGLQKTRARQDKILAARQTRTRQRV